jgi:phosphohistidine phosphatase
MKKLMLIRHAKAEKETSVKDFDRPLKYIGIQDATFMAERVKSNSIVPQLIITSPALRTKTTAEIFADHLGLPEPTSNKSIYEASEKTWLSIINKLSNDLDFVAIVGHNPGISQIMYYLTGDPREVHTCAVALIELDTDDWASLTEDAGKLAYFSSPKE